MKGELKCRKSRQQQQQRKAKEEEAVAATALDSQSISNDKDAMSRTTSENCSPAALSSSPEIGWPVLWRSFIRLSPSRLARKVSSSKRIESAPRNGFSPEFSADFFSVLRTENDKTMSGTSSPEIGQILTKHKNAKKKSNTNSPELRLPVNLTDSNQRSIDEYFTTRRQSSRIIQSKIKEERQLDLVRRVNEGGEKQLEVHNLQDKGRAVFTKRVIEKDEFVLEYVGDLISLKEARRREREYAQNASIGCYMFYFSIDATAESCRLGRLVNHSRLRYNLVTKVMSINGHPRLLLIACRTIDQGEELLYDYGDRTKASLREHPWLAT